MSYEYREVKCPWCEHIFMWNSLNYEQDIYEYKIKEAGEYAGKAKCPKCGKSMLVMPHVLDCIDIFDDRIELIGIRGI